MQPRPAAAPPDWRRGRMNVSKHDPDLQASASPGPRRRRRFAWIGTAASLVIFAASIYVLWHMAAEMNAAEVKAAFTAATARQLGTAAGLTVIVGQNFWLGMGAVLGWSCIREAGPLAVLVYTNIKIKQSIGVAAAATVAGYLSWVSLKRRVVTIQ